MPPGLSDDYPRSAGRLFTAMSCGPISWSAQHLEKLLTGFGFVKRDSGAHTFYRHRRRQELALAAPRSRRLRPCLVADACRTVGRLLASDAEESK